ncbi:hypothetical protein FAES_4637 [Fibrella aestuarina BUZ 2]|uniref:Uncharacterized protein n=2 Tax=Fibrella TaxID=861914 RepID=I0KET3_9BACT|nr:hypothetical protein FAES_4637 [Fibrella aestuarina BUZ 2]
MAGEKGASSPDMSYAGQGRDGAMQAVLTAKVNDTTLQAGLLATGDSYLLEYNETQGRDDYWSDNNDGHGGNKLGVTLMQIRAHYGGSNAPAGTYTVKAFTDQVQVR